MASTSDEGRLASLVNNERAKHGIARVTLSSDLVAIAHRHSAAMARRRAISHDPNLTSEVRGWRALAENVGRGSSVSVVHGAFMRSGEHRSHILDSTYREIGTGVVRGSDGNVYVTEVFVNRGSVRVTHAAPRHRVHAARTVRRPSRPHPAPKPKAAAPPVYPPPDQSVDLLLRMLALDAADGVQTYMPSTKDPP